MPANHEAKRKLGNPEAGRRRSYISWRDMRRRCAGPNPYSKYYADRGIKVCERWQKFENFLADMGERPIGLTLDRINNDKNYEPENCRWATPLQQTLNRRVQRPGRLVGISRLKNGKWRAYSYVYQGGKRQVHLGTFPSKQQAAAAVRAHSGAAS